MKDDTTTTLLNFVLYVLVILCVGFAIWSILRTRDLRQMGPKVQADEMVFQAKLSAARELLNDVMTYNASAKSPELDQIIKGAKTPQPAAKQ
jgi:hypothetical protein